MPIKNVFDTKVELKADIKASDVRMDFKNWR